MLGFSNDCVTAVLALNSFDADYLESPFRTRGNAAGPLQSRWSPVDRSGAAHLHIAQFSKNRHGRFRDSEILRHVFERVVAGCIAAGPVGGEGLCC